MPSRRGPNFRRVYCQTICFFTGSISSTREPAIDPQRRRRIAAFALIVEHDQIARPGQARLDQMGVMLAADLVDRDAARSLRWP